MPKKRWPFYLVLLTAALILLAPLYLFGEGKNGEIASLEELINRYDSALPNFNDRAGTSARLREALPLEVETLGYVFQFDPGKHVPLVVLKTRITNKAGHRIPDG